MNDFQLVVAVSNGLRPPLGGVYDENNNNVEKKNDVVVEVPLPSTTTTTTTTSPRPTTTTASWVPNDLARLIQSMWHTNPSQRPTIEQVCEELDRLHLSTPRVSSVERNRSSSISLDLFISRNVRESLV